MEERKNYIKSSGAEEIQNRLAILWDSANSDVQEKLGRHSDYTMTIRNYEERDIFKMKRKKKQPKETSTSGSFLLSPPPGKNKEVLKIPQKEKEKEIIKIKEDDTESFGEWNTFQSGTDVDFDKWDAFQSGSSQFTTKFGDFRSSTSFGDFGEFGKKEESEKDEPKKEENPTDNWANFEDD